MIKLPDGAHCWVLVSYGNSLDHENTMEYNYKCITCKAERKVIDTIHLYVGQWID